MTFTVDARFLLACRTVQSQ